MKTKLKTLSLLAVLGTSLSFTTSNAQSIVPLGEVLEWPVPDFLPKDGQTGIPISNDTGSPARVYTIGLGIMEPNTYDTWSYDFLSVLTDPSNGLVVPTPDDVPDYAQVLLGLGRVLPPTDDVAATVTIPDHVLFTVTSTNSTVQVPLVAIRGGYYARRGSSSHSVNLSEAQTDKGADIGGYSGPVNWSHLNGLSKTTEDCASIQEPLSASVSFSRNNVALLDAEEKPLLERVDARSVTPFANTTEARLYATSSAANAINATVFAGKVSPAATTSQYTVIYLSEGNISSHGLLLDNIVVTGGRASGSGNLSESVDSEYHASTRNSNYGGGIFVRALRNGGLDLHFNSMVFYRNVASQRGGAIYIEGLDFVNNSADQNRPSLARVTISNVSFMDNRVESGGEGGGALHASLSGPNSRLHVLQSVFDTNRASNSAGGAVYIGGWQQLSANSENYFVSNVFYGNTASAVGGAVFATNHTRSGWLNNTFVNNSTTGTAGGALYFDANASTRVIATVNPLTRTQWTYGLGSYAPVFHNNLILANRTSLSSLPTPPDGEQIGTIPTITEFVEGTGNVIERVATGLIDWNETDASARGSDNIIGAGLPGTSQADGLMPTSTASTLFNTGDGTIYELLTGANGVFRMVPTTDAGNISVARNFRWGYNKLGQQIVDVYFNANFDDHHFAYIPKILQGSQADVNNPTGATYDYWWKFGLDVLAAIPAYTGSAGAANGDDYWYYQQMSHRRLSVAVDVGAYEYRTYANVTPTSTVGIVYVDDNAPGDANGVHDGNSWMSAYLFVEDAILRAALDPDVLEIHIAEAEREVFPSSFSPNTTVIARDQIELKWGLLWQKARDNVRYRYVPGRPSVQTVTVGDVEWNWLYDNATNDVQIPFALDNRPSAIRYTSYPTPSYFTTDRYMEAYVSYTHFDTENTSSTSATAPFGRTYLRARTPASRHTYMRILGSMLVEESVSPVSGAHNDAIAASVADSYGSESLMTKLATSRNQWYRYNLDPIAARSGTSNRGIAIRGGYKGWSLDTSVSSTPSVYGVYSPWKLYRTYIMPTPPSMPTAPVYAPYNSARLGTETGVFPSNSLVVNTYALQFARFPEAYNRDYAAWTPAVGSQRLIIDYETILSGNLDPANSNRSQRIFQLNEDIYVRLCGLTIRDADATRNGPATVDGIGAGLYLSGPAKVLLVDSAVWRNRAFQGAGIYNMAAYLHIDARWEPVERPLISENFAINAGGGIYLSGFDYEMEEGAAILHMYNTTLQYNIASDENDRYGVYTRGGGLYAEPGSILDVYNADVIANIAGFGAGMFLDNMGYFYAQQSNFVSNWAHWEGGAINMRNSATNRTTENYGICTTLFAGNRADPPYSGSYDLGNPPRGGAIYSYNSQAMIDHSVFYANSAPRGPAWVDDVSPILGSDHVGSGELASPIIPRLEVFNSIITDNRWYRRETASVVYQNVQQIAGKIRIDDPNHPFYLALQSPQWDWDLAHDTTGLGIIWSLVEPDDFFYGDPEIGPTVEFGDPHFNRVDAFKGPRGFYWTDYFNYGLDDTVLDHGAPAAPLPVKYRDINLAKGVDVIFGTSSDEALGFQVLEGFGLRGSYDIYGNRARHMGVYSGTDVVPYFIAQLNHLRTELKTVHAVDDWYYSGFFGGYVNLKPGVLPWFYSADYGWIFPLAVDGHTTIQNGSWLWAATIGDVVWTSGLHFPYVWSSVNSDWILWGN